MLVKITKVKISKSTRLALKPTPIVFLIVLGILSYLRANIFLPDLNLFPKNQTIKKMYMVTANMDPENTPGRELKKVLPSPRLFIK